MKLRKVLPDKAGWWWCWRKEYRGPVVQYVGHGGFYTSSPLAIPEGITHFAGPIEQPEIPEPERVEINGSIINLGVYSFNVQVDGLAAQIPYGFENHLLKITIEKIDG